jgi:hypothetical protein
LKRGNLSGAPGDLIRVMDEVDPDGYPELCPARRSLEIGVEERGDDPKENKVMAFKVQELMVNVMSGKAMLLIDDVSTCMTRTIGPTTGICSDGSIAFRKPAAPQAQLALLRQELRTAVAQA